MKPRRSSEPSKPTQHALEQIQKAALRVAPDVEAMKEWCERYVSIHTTRLAHDLDLLGRHASPGASVLEIGSAPPVLTTAAKEAGYQIVGVDVAPERFQSTIDACGLTIHQCDIEKQPLPLDDASVDVVLFNEVFEHLRIDLIFTISELYRVLKPGGLLLMSTPNLRSINGLVNFLFRDRSFSCTRDIYEQYEKLQAIGHMGHVREYTATEASDFLSRSGFEIEEVIYRGKAPSAPKRAITFLLPRLRTVFSCVARKPAHGAG